jgi:uncharacterized protein YhbP (UPF0306 family)
MSLISNGKTRHVELTPIGSRVNLTVTQLRRTVLAFTSEMQATGGMTPPAISKLSLSVRNSKKE